jgi:hypothetical protein
MAFEGKLQAACRSAPNPAQSHHAQQRSVDMPNARKE